MAADSESGSEALWDDDAILKYFQDSVKSYNRRQLNASKNKKNCKPSSSEGTSEFGDKHNDAKESMNASKRQRVQLEVEDNQALDSDGSEIFDADAFNHANGAIGVPGPWVPVPLSQSKMVRKVDSRHGDFFFPQPEGERDLGEEPDLSIEQEFEDAEVREEVEEGMRGEEEESSDVFSGHFQRASPPEGPHKSDSHSNSCSNADYYSSSRVRSSILEQDPLEEALSSMLMSWYQSGYATGRYQTLLELSRSGRQDYASDTEQIPMSSGKNGT